MNEDIQNKIKILTDDYNLTKVIAEKEPIMEKIVNLLLKEAEKDPKNNDVWLKLMALEYNLPWQFYDRFEKYINKILENDPENIEGLIVSAYTLMLFFGKKPDDIILKLSQYKGTDPEKKAMALIMLNLYYKGNKNSEMVEQYLKEAITLAPHFAKPYFDLGSHYLSNYKDREESAKALFRMGLKNVVHRTWGQYYVNLTDINEFFQEYITGIHSDRLLIERIMKYV